MAALHVRMNLLDHPFLSACKREGQGVETAVESLSDTVHHDAVFRPASDIFLLQKRQLEIEKLLELEPVPGLFQRSHILGEMYVPECKMQRHKTVLLHDVFRKRLFDV